MINVIYNAQTGETTIEDVPDIEAPIVNDATDAKAEALDAIKNATTLLSLKEAMLNYIAISGVN